MGIIYKLIIRLRDYEGSWTLLYRTKAEAQAALDRICDAMRTGERIIHLEKNPPRGGVLHNQRCGRQHSLHRIPVHLQGVRRPRGHRMNRISRIARKYGINVFVIGLMDIPEEERSVIRRKLIREME